MNKTAWKRCALALFAVFTLVLGVLLTYDGYQLGALESFSPELEYITASVVETKWNNGGRGSPWEDIRMDNGTTYTLYGTLFFGDPAERSQGRFDLELFYRTAAPGTTLTMEIDPETDVVCSLEMDGMQWLALEEGLEWDYREAYDVSFFGFSLLGASLILFLCLFFHFYRKNNTKKSVHRGNL